METIFFSNFMPKSFRKHTKIACNPKCTQPLFIVWTASWLSTSLGPFSRGQTHWPNVNRCTLLISTRRSPKAASKRSLVPKAGRAPICVANFSNNILRSGSIWKLNMKRPLSVLIITIKLRNIYFYNSMDLSGLFFKFVNL